MIYIFTALYSEAHIFIKKFNLIKNLENTWFQEFYNETAGIRLTVTGVGEIAAATAVGTICTMYKPTHNDLLCNIGICAHTLENSGIFICNKLIEKATGRTFYPDMLYHHNFDEGTIVTGMMPLNLENDSEIPLDIIGRLYDMEAAAIYQAGIHFLGPHQMIFLKIVSDKGTTKDVSKEQVIFLMESYQKNIFDYLIKLSNIIQKNISHNSSLHQNEELVETFCRDMHCSKAMKDTVQQYIRYFSLTGIDYISIIQKMYEKELLPCKNKREGKLCFEDFKRRLF